MTSDASKADQLPRFSAIEITSDPDCRLAWLEAIQSLGLTLVTESPKDPKVFEEWLDDLLIVRDMNWGKYFDVVYQPDGEYIANKGINIPPHVDGPTREYLPGVRCFHCVENTVEGGESCWVDSFHVAETLKYEHPEDFRLLTTVPWSMANRNKDTEYFCRAPLITLDRNGRISDIRDAHWLREPLVTDFDLVESVYRASGLWDV